MTQQPQSANDPAAGSAAPGIATPAGRANTDGIGDPCGNCGAILRGPHCHQCGQPVKGLVRHFSSMLGDLLDTFLQLDTRIARTLSPLLLRPGFLSCEYFAGRRVRYVSPVRLFFFLSVLAFLVAQWTLDSQPQVPQTIQVDNLQNASTIAEAQRLRDSALQKIAARRVQAAKVPAVGEALNYAEADVRRQADMRISELQRAHATNTPPPVHGGTLEFDHAPWDPVKHPLHSNWLPPAGNAWLNSLVGRAKGNLQRIRQDPKVLLDAWMSALPSTLFLLLPLFALLLKIAYVFKRRLYMEHFIVALHSHAFLCLDLLLILLLNGFDDVLGWHWAHAPLQFAIFVLIMWMPFYLLLMQKRVYGQRWPLTLLKYSVIGVVYMILLGIGVTLSLLAKIVWL